MPDNNSTTTINDDDSRHPNPASSDSSIPTTLPTPSTPQDQDSRPTSSAALTPPPVDKPESSSKSSIQAPDIYAEVARHISEAKNVLIALSSDPSVDEMAAAIGLSIYLDRLGKRATAIYSGTTPNALEFLKPEQTFEPTADTLQDFVVALSKDKADHLRYKLDGSYVKIYITPYRSRISENDLDFSYGDYNVDLVLALDISNGIDLDSALREHGRIMHDAVIINITTSNPGKFGEIEWSDKKASSVSEMIARLLYNVNSEVEVGKEEATAFLTGIVAATNRFSNANTTPETMEVSSLLMGSGANQQLVSKNITPDVDNEIIDSNSTRPTLSKEVSADSDDIESEAGRDGDPSSRRKLANQELDIDHHQELDDQDEIKQPSADNDNDNDNDNDKILLDDLKVAEESLSHTGTETTPEATERPLEINSKEAETPAMAEAELRDSPTGEDDSGEDSNSYDKKVLIKETEPAPTEDFRGIDNEVSIKEMDTAPAVDSKDVSGLPETPRTDFDARMDEDDNRSQSDAVDSLPKVVPLGQDSSITSSTQQSTNPIAANIPDVPTRPEVNGVPDINYTATSDEEVLPPPPAPPIGPFNSALPPTQSTIPTDTNPTTPVDTQFTVPVDVRPASAEQAPGSSESVNSAIPPVVTAPQSITPIEPTSSVTNAEKPAAPTSLGPQPAMQDQIYVPQASDPSAFKIPGM